MKSMAIILMAVLGVIVSAQEPLPACPDPPYNNAVAKLVSDALDAFRVNMVTGVPELGIPPLDPLGPIPYVPFNVTNESLDIEGTVNDTMVYNLAQYIICELTLEFGLRQSFTIDLRLDNFHMDGNYDIDGAYLVIFPIYGTGTYVLDTYNSSISGDATLKYNIITDRASIKDLLIDIRFEELALFLECILGCGDMADFVNGFISELATAIFNSVWDAIQPILNDAIEDGVNAILYDIKISEVIPIGNNTEVLKMQVPLMDIINRK